ncbi:MAG: hypothetical protein IJ033_04045 [Clostridia bacterium]|nr:hypothetical protein [Clostridia bacterium]
MKSIIDLVWEFRQAIDIAKANRKFNYRDRFSRFPNGCCDDACDLLGKYLLGKGIHTVQIQGTFRDGDPEHTTGHAWLQLDDGIIIDITGDQFRYDELFLKFNQPVYVGEISVFHSLFEIDRTVSNCDVDRNSRLKEIYEIISDNI